MPKIILNSPKTATLIRSAIGKAMSVAPQSKKAMPTPMKTPFIKLENLSFFVKYGDTIRSPVFS
jgi:hypothetical protein